MRHRRDELGPLAVDVAAGQLARPPGEQRQGPPELAVEMEDAVDEVVADGARACDGHAPSGRIAGNKGRSSSAPQLRQALPPGSPRLAGLRLDRARDMPPVTASPTPSIPAIIRPLARIMAQRAADRRDRSRHAGAPCYRRAHDPHRPARRLLQSRPIAATGGSASPRSAARAGRGLVAGLAGQSAQAGEGHGAARRALRLGARAARRAPIRPTAIERELGTRYTVDTLRALIRRYPRPALHLADGRRQSRPVPPLARLAEDRRAWCRLRW